MPTGVITQAMATESYWDRMGEAKFLPLQAQPMLSVELLLFFT